LAILLGERTNVGRVLARLPLSGGAPREALEHVISADWSPDGESLAVIRNEGSKRRVEYPAGTVLYETADTQPNALRVSPDGEAVAFIEFAGGRPFLKVITRSGSVKLTAPVGEYPVAVWSASGRELWFTQGTQTETTLLAVNLSGRQRTVMRIPGWGKLHDISRDGRALLSVSHDYFGVLCLSPGETRERELSWLGTSHVLDISADGKLLLIHEAPMGLGSPTLYLRRTDGSPAVRLGLISGSGGRLSPDGKWVSAARRDAKPPGVLIPTGAGDERPVTVTGLEEEAYVHGWLPDGKRYVMWGKERGKKVFREFVWNPSTRALRPITPESISFDLVSTDGLQLLYRGPDMKWYAVSTSGGDARAVRGLKESDNPICWGQDVRSVFVTESDANGKLRFLRVNLEAGERTVWKEIVAPPGDQRVGGAVITPDGRSYAYDHQRGSSELYLAEGLK
jgi:Tol biopolymer transport system component